MPQVQIRCDSEMRQEWKKMCADYDADYTYAQMLDVVVKAYWENPELFRRVDEFGPTFSDY